MRYKQQRSLEEFEKKKALLTSTLDLIIFCFWILSNYVFQAVFHWEYGMDNFTLQAFIYLVGGCIQIYFLFVGMDKLHLCQSS